MDSRADAFEPVLPSRRAFVSGALTSLVAPRPSLAADDARGGTPAGAGAGERERPAPWISALGRALKACGPCSLDSGLVKGDGAHDDWEGLQRLVDEATRAGEALTLVPRPFPQHYALSRPLVVPDMGRLAGTAEIFPFDGGPWHFPQQMTPNTLRPLSDFVGDTVLLFGTGAVLSDFTVAGPPTLGGRPLTLVAPLVRQRETKGRFARDARLLPGDYGDRDALPYGAGFARLDDVCTIGGMRGFDMTFAEGVRLRIAGFYAQEAILYCGAGLADSIIDFLWAVGATGTDATSGKGAYIADCSGVQEFRYVVEECQGDAIHLYNSSAFDCRGKNSHNGGAGLRLVDCRDGAFGGLMQGNGYRLPGAKAHVICEGNDARAVDPGCQRIRDAGSAYVLFDDGVHPAAPDFIFATTSAKSTLRTSSFLPAMREGVFADARTRGIVETDDTQGNLLINADFRLDQRGVGREGDLAPDAYGPDGWKAGAGGCRFAHDGRSTLVLARGSLMQTVDGAEAVDGGTYALTWDGDAEPTLQGHTRPAGAAAKWIVVDAILAGANLTVVIGPGSIRRLELHAGSSARLVEARSGVQELPRAQRLFEVGTVELALRGRQSWAAPITFAVTKRVVPKVTLTVHAGTAKVTAVHARGMDVAGTADPNGRLAFDWTAAADL